MEYILSAMLLHNSVSRPSQISDKEYGDLGPTVWYGANARLSDFSRNIFFRESKQTTILYKYKFKAYILAMIALEI